MTSLMSTAQMKNKSIGTYLKDLEGKLQWQFFKI